ncbi:hypothetical protein OC835_006724 [Tilletia horrida]|nr:hypothetical protein OC835_006724 [Tilletia horrida]
MTPTLTRNLQNEADAAAQLRARLDAVLQTIARLEARVATLEAVSTLCAPNPNTTPAGGSAPRSAPVNMGRPEESGAHHVSSSMRAPSPGSSLGLGFTGPPSTASFSTGGVGAAAALAGRFGKLTSIAQGRRLAVRHSTGTGPVASGSGGSTGGASGSNSSSSGTGIPADNAMPRTRPMTFKNGITLIKDRRPLEKAIHTRHLRGQFEVIVENNRLRTRPHISKNATAWQVDNAITQSFLDQGHALHTDGQTGFEYAAQDLRAIGPEKMPKEHLSGDQLAAEYAKRECYIVVKSKLKFSAYDPLFFALVDEISDDEDGDDDDDLPNVMGEDYKKCPFFRNTFCIDTIAEHEASCQEGFDKPAVKAEIVKQETPDLFPADPGDNAGPSRASSSGSSSLSDVHGACWCGQLDHVAPMLTCSGPGCDEQRHVTCVVTAPISSTWLCSACTDDEQRQGGLDEEKDDKDHSEEDDQPQAKPTSHHSVYSRPGQGTQD